MVYVVILLLVALLLAAVALVRVFVARRRQDPANSNSRRSAGDPSEAISEPPLTYRPTIPARTTYFAEEPEIVPVPVLVEDSLPGALIEPPSSDSSAPDVEPADLCTSLDSQGNETQGVCEYVDTGAVSSSADPTPSFDTPSDWSSPSVDSSSTGV
jgi:hypothetical protein